MKIHILFCLLFINYASADDLEAIIAENMAILASKAKMKSAREGDADAIKEFEGRIRALDWTTKLSQEESYQRWEKEASVLKALAECESEIVSEFKEYIKCLPDVPWSKDVPYSYNAYEYRCHRYTGGALQGALLCLMAEHDLKNFEVLVKDSLANDQTSDERKRTIALALGVGTDFFLCEELLLKIDAKKQGQVRYSLAKLRRTQFEKWDANEDSIITHEEYSNAVSAQPKLLAKFRGYDLDGDGKLTHLEFQSVSRFLGLK